MGDPSSREKSPRPVVGEKRRLFWVRTVRVGVVIACVRIGLYWTIFVLGSGKHLGRLVVFCVLPLLPEGLLFLRSENQPAVVIGLTLLLLIGSMTIAASLTALEGALSRSHKSPPGRG